jgi:hypothetical protein
VPEPQPRRRQTDKDRRRWNDLALDLLGQRVESHAEDIEDVKAEMRAVARLPAEFAAFRREFEEWKSERRDDLIELRKSDAETRDELRELRRENREQHRRVAYGMDPRDGKTPLPPRPATLTWGSVAKVATIIGTFFGSAAIIVAALLAGH